MRISDWSSDVCSSDLPLDKATEYAAEDADITFRLWQLLKLRLPQEGVTRVYEMVDRPLVSAVAKMERTGIKVDRENLSRLSAEFASEIEALEQEIYAEAGMPFTIGRSEEHTSELQSLMRTTYAVFCLKK